ncbi:inhibitor of vertebrate lysozyme family protein [Pseudomonas sp. R2.Fl]|nr:inhibitor of vertebrate lysozyme family protein [Pseudomonas sp. R2.Fl]
MKRTALILLLALLPAMPAIAQQDLAGRFLSRVVAESEPHRTALTKLIRGRGGIPSWVRNMISRDDYVALASEAVEVAGAPMELFRACQPKTCPDSEIRVLFSADGRRAVMLSRDAKAGELLLGEPSAAERAVLSAPAP